MGEHLSATRRRELGAHYTPEPLAQHLCELSLLHLGRIPRLVVDPSCGGGAFLLAAADALLDRGVEPSEIIANRLLGIEVDDASAERAVSALRSWGEDHGTSVTPNVIVADSLEGSGPRDRSSGASIIGGADLVIGNPPFLSQLDSDTAMDGDQRARLQSRFGFKAAYTDISAFHLLAATELLAPDGVVCMIQPQSVLGARDAAPVREALLRRCRLVGLWGSGGSHFSAEVRVCAPILRTSTDRRGKGSTAVHWELADGADAVVTEAPSGAASWSRLLALGTGVPPVTARSVRLLGDVAKVTAGFRDEFYAVAECTVEAEETGTTEPETTGRSRIATGGLIDPGQLRWGRRAVRIARRSFARPVLDHDQLTERYPRVAAWVAQRLVPKVLVATQTKVLEAAVDPLGDVVPLTPVVSVEPTDPGVTPEMICSLLTAPAMSALMHTRVAGTGMTSEAFRVSASTLAALPVPTDLQRWRTLTAELPGGGSELPVSTEAMRDLSPILNRISADCISWEGTDRADAEHRLVEWWLERLPRSYRDP